MAVVPWPSATAAGSVSFGKTKWRAAGRSGLPVRPPGVRRRCCRWNRRQTCFLPEMMEAVVNPRGSGRLRLRMDGWACRMARKGEWCGQGWLERTQNLHFCDQYDETTLV